MVFEIFRGEIFHLKAYLFVHVKSQSTDENVDD